MYCPSCGSEYREGFSRCVDCEVDLVDAPPHPASADPDPDSGDLETVFSTGDPVALLTAKTLLDEAGIAYLTRGEGIQDLFGMGRLGTGFNVLTGPMEIQVGARKVREAMDLLHAADLDEGKDDEDEDDEEDDEDDEYGDLPGDEGEEE